jgi:histidinol dehydrogenase
MKTVIVALAFALVATAAARPAFARRHDDFELKELRVERAEHQEEKAAIQEEEVEEKEKAQAHVRAKPHPQERHSHATTEDSGGGDLDGD